MKERLQFTIANALAAFMDFGVGALITSMLFMVTGTPTPAFAWCIGGILALLPDFDIVPTILLGRFVAFDHHQTLLHRPLLLITLVTSATLLFIDPLWAIIAFCCLFYHFLHDTGWNTKRLGITWFWPFDERYVASHGFYHLTDPYSHKEWLNRFWFVPSRVSVGELLIGATSLSLSFYLMEWYWPASIVLPLGVILMAAWLWFFCKQS